MERSYHKNQVYQYLPLLKLKIEKQLGIPRNQEMHHKDFQLLEEQIFAATKVRISTSTLKRIWGTVKYESLPQIQTIDVLSRFAGYRNWYHFVKKKKSSRFINKKVFFSLFIIFCVVTALFYYFNTTPPGYTFNFFCKNQEYPADIRVNYAFDKAVDDFYIKFSFSDHIISLKEKDSLLLKRIYHPGLQHVKLFYKKKLLEKHSFFVNTHGWVVTESFQHSAPWFKKNVTIENGKLYNLPSIADNEHTAHLNYYQKFEDYQGLLEMKTLFRLSYSDKNTVFHKATIGLDFEHGMIDLGFISPGNKSKSHLIIGKEVISGFKNDLINMEIEKDVWNPLMVKLKDSVVVAQLDGEEIFRYPVQSSLGKFTGMNFHSKDTIAFEYVTITGKNGDVIYKDDFEEKR